jgi:hypothetical protein
MASKKHAVRRPPFEVPGTFIFPTVTMLALWDYEITSQLSDGYWENSRPSTHWQFWCRLEKRVILGEGPRVETDKPYMCERTNYNLRRLLSKDVATSPYELRNRMLRYAQMALALDYLKRQNDIEVGRSAADYMPPTLEEWRALKASGAWQYDFIAGYMSRVDDELAVAYYQHEGAYKVDDLKREIDAIKAAMVAVKPALF